MSKNIRKIKNFNSINTNSNNEDIFLLSNENYLSLYNIYNIDDLYTFINNLKKNTELFYYIKYNIICLIIDCWIINNIKILKNHNSYFIDLIKIYINFIDSKIIDTIKKLKNYSKLDSYISKYIKYWISLDNKFPLINNNFFLPEIISYLKKLYNI